MRERTGAAVVAVERGGKVLVELDNEFQVRPDDVLFVCGTLGSLDQYVREFRATPADHPRI